MLNRRSLLTLAGTGAVALALARPRPADAKNLDNITTAAMRGSIDATARVWDLAAGWLLVEEAGGAIEMLEGAPPWPLEPGDYSGRGFATVAAVDGARMHSVRAGIKPR